SRIEAGRVRWKRERVDLQRMIHEVYLSQDAAAGRKGLHVTIDAPEPLPLVGDEDYLVQVVWNLIANAIKYTPDGGSITVHGRRAEDVVELVVEDDGVGIPPEFHEKIFEKFWRVPEANMEQAKGSGLGLAVSLAIVTAHQGTIRVDSTPGHGSKFTVCLPTTLAQPATRPSGSHSGPYYVLLLSDKQRLVEAVRSILEKDGHQVHQHPNSRDAVDLVRAERPDAVFVDVFMEEGAGFEVLRQLRETRDLDPIPVWTLSLMDETAGAASFCSTAQEFFRKPVESSRLLAAISRWVPQREAPVQIMVVDDDPAIVNAVIQLLSAHGYDCTGALDGIEAVVRAREENPDLIILDVYMPSLNGLEVIRRLRNRPETSRIPIIVLTASDVQLDRARMLEELSAGTPFAITKENLATALRSALAELPGAR
ncbi:MAG: ATP-binding response regulator, partial [Candidatus Xenobia bacterium]